MADASATQLLNFTGADRGQLSSAKNGLSSSNFSEKADNSAFSKVYDEQQAAAGTSPGSSAASTAPPRDGKASGADDGNKLPAERPDSAAADGSSADGSPSADGSSTADGSSRADGSAADVAKNAPAEDTAGEGAVDPTAVPATMQPADSLADAASGDDAQGRQARLAAIAGGGAGATQSAAPGDFEPGDASLLSRGAAAEAAAAGGATLRRNEMSAGFASLERSLRGPGEGGELSLVRETVLSSRESVLPPVAALAAATGADLAASGTRAPDASLGSLMPLSAGAAGSTNSTLPTATGSLLPEYALASAPSDPEFAEEVTARMQTLLRDGLREARLQLNPAELGRLQVTITTEGDQARVLFVAENSAARDAIEQSLPRLRDMLEQSGLQLAQSDVGQQQSFDQNAPGFAAGEGGSDAAHDAGDVSSGAGPVQFVTRSGVDTYV